MSHMFARYYNETNSNRDAREGGIAPCPEVSLEISWFIQIDFKQIYGSFREPRKFRIVFYNFCYFWGTLCYWTETSTIGSDFFIISIALNTLLPYRYSGVPEQKSKVLLFLEKSLSILRYVKHDVYETSPWVRWITQPIP